MEPSRRQKPAVWRPVSTPTLRVKGARRGGATFALACAGTMSFIDLEPSGGERGGALEIHGERTFVRGIYRPPQNARQDEGSLLG